MAHPVIRRREPAATSEPQPAGKRRRAVAGLVAALMVLGWLGARSAAAQEERLICPAELGGRDLSFEKAWLDEESSVDGQEADGLYVVTSFRKLLCGYENPSSFNLNTVDVVWFSTDHADYTFGCHDGYDVAGEPPSEYLASPTHYVEAIIRVKPRLAAAASALAARLISAAEAVAPRCGEPPTEGGDDVEDTVAGGEPVGSTTTTTEDVAAKGDPDDIGADQPDDEAAAGGTPADDDVDARAEPEPSNEPGDQPSDGPSEEALLIAAGLILLLLGGGSVARSRRRKRPPGESVGDRGARQIGGFLLHFPPDLLLQRLGITKAPEEAAPAPQDQPEHRPSRTPVPPFEELERHFAESVAYRAEQGYRVRNRNLIEKSWNTFLDPFWNDPTSGQCGEYAEWGEQWTRGFVRDRFGPDALVDTIVVEERSTVTPDGIRDGLDGLYRANHAATRVILPDGRRLVLDYWDALGRNLGSPPRLRDESDWAADWMAEIGEGMVDRPEAELTLKNYVEQYGSERAFDAYRRTMEKEGRGALAEVLIRSWDRQPW